MICKYCVRLEERMKKVKVSQFSFVEERIKINYCPIQKRNIYSLEMSGCLEGKLSPELLGNFRVD